MEFKRSLVQEEELYRHSIIAFIPVQDIAYQHKLFKLSQSQVRIAWTMRAFPDLSGKHSWGSQDHFSTLPTSSMPESGAEFFKALVQFMMSAWSELCESIDRYLISCVGFTLSPIVPGTCIADMTANIP